jgi:hypothetical protein
MVRRLTAGGRWIRTSGSAPDKGSGPRFRFAPELMATDDGSRRIDGRMQPKPAIFALSRACIERGTGSSNPFPSSGESQTNFGADSFNRTRKWGLPCRRRASEGTPLQIFTVAPGSAAMLEMEGGLDALTSQHERLT